MPDEPDEPGVDIDLFAQQNLSTFPANFFANPFAVSFPDDIPCPTAIAMAPPEAIAPETGNTFSVSPATIHPLPSDAPRIQQRPSPQLASPDSSSEPAPMQYHFIDMADRKSVMRIRNTRISRQHKENKVRRIAELERKLAAALARIEELEAAV
ncbi:hypothetical protein DV735_g2650, partial [Chaetothyriales sp. CBS 134920]